MTRRLIALLALLSGLAALGGTNGAAHAAPAAACNAAVADWAVQSSENAQARTKRFAQDNSGNQSAGVSQRLHALPIGSLPTLWIGVDRALE